MESFKIYKKRDGQLFELFGDIYAYNFSEAKKQFASDMTSCNWELSNDIVWLDKDEDGVDETGWYDLNGSVIVEKEDPEDPNYTVVDYSLSDMELFCSKQSIDDGFSYWVEDVYTYELRDNK